MMTVTRAAKLVGTSKVALTRMILAGELHGTRSAQGPFMVAPGDLATAFPAWAAAADRRAGLSGADIATPSAGHDAEVTARLTAIEDETRRLRGMLDVMQRAIGDAPRQDWRRTVGQ